MIMLNLASSRRSEQLFFWFLCIAQGVDHVNVELELALEPYYLQRVTDIVISCTSLAKYMHADVVVRTEASY